MDTDSTSDIAVYRSHSHPSGRSRRGVFGVEMVTPLGIAMLPVMIGTLVAMLQGYPVLSIVYVGSPIALVLAFIWTWIRLRSEVCEILISDHRVAIRSVFSAAQPVEALQWKLIIDMQRRSDGIGVTLGLEEFSLVTSEWPAWSHLVRDLAASMNPTSDH